MIPKVEPWPLAELPWGFTSDFYHLGVHMVIDDPLKWEWPKIAIIGGSKAMFKFVHKTGPIMSSCHLYDHVVRDWLNNINEEKCEYCCNVRGTS